MDLKKVKWIATDIDGTLKPYTAEYHEEERDRLVKLIKNKSILSIISGRPISGALHYAQIYGLSETPIVACNGALLYHQGNIVKKHAMSDLKPIYSYIKEADSLGITTLVTFERTEYCYKETSWVRKNRKANDPFPALEDALFTDAVTQTGIYKLSLLCESSPKTDKFLLDLQKNLSSNYEVVIYSKYGCEITAKGVNKALGLQELANYLALPIDAIAAIGDNENDIDMVKLAGVGVAVANAKASVKQVANYICNHEATAGVEEFVEQVIARNN